MDRFIENKEKRPNLHCRDLKSNMDRFIVQKLPRNRRYNKYLKSNMDRFIDFAYFEFPQPAEFKIQYR